MKKSLILLSVLVLYLILVLIYNYLVGLTPQLIAIHSGIVFIGSLVFWYMRKRE